MGESIHTIESVRTSYVNANVNVKPIQNQSTTIGLHVRAIRGGLLHKKDKMITR